MFPCNKPVAGQHRHNVIDRNGKTARRQIIVDQRQAADSLGHWRDVQLQKNQRKRWREPLLRI